MGFEILYIIGILFTGGFIWYIDNQLSDPEFKGFKGYLLYTILVITWPYFLGAFIGKLLIQDKKER